MTMTPSYNIVNTRRKCRWQVTKARVHMPPRKINDISMPAYDDRSGECRILNIFYASFPLSPVLHPASSPLPPHCQMVSTAHSTLALPRQQE